MQVTVNYLIGGKMIRFIDKLPPNDSLIEVKGYVDTNPRKHFTKRARFINQRILFFRPFSIDDLNLTHSESWILVKEFKNEST